MKTTTIHSGGMVGLRYEDKKFIFIIDHRYDDLSNRLYVFCQKAPHGAHRLPLWVMIA